MIALAPSDLELEQRIEIASSRLCRDGTKESWDELVELVKQRSPQQILRMEKRLGLDK